MEWRSKVWVLALVSLVLGEDQSWDQLEHEMDGWRAQNGPVRPICVTWTTNSEEMTFRVEAQTTGWVGLGLVRQYRQHKKTDVIVGWVDDDGQALIQDRYEGSKNEVRLDRKQNVELVAGFENRTHTTVIFRRKKETCDRDEDVAITSDSLRVVYVIHPEDPVNPNRTLNYGKSWRGSTSVVLAPRPPDVAQKSREWWLSSAPQHPLHWDLINRKIVIPRDEDSLHLCRVFQLPSNMTRKHHVIGFEPIVPTNTKEVLRHVQIHSCHPTSSDEMEQLDELSSGDRGHHCRHYDLPQVLKTCHTLFLVWAVGSKGALFPQNVGLSLDPDAGPKYLYAEFQYETSGLKSGAKDVSGLRLWCSPNLRADEGGVMAVGLLPDWKHIIPPQQPAIMSYGHCVGQCTKRSFPPTGIKVFGSILHTRALGRRVKLRHIQNGTELQPIAEDAHYDYNYQQIRLLSQYRNVLPGDELIVECTYNSKARHFMAVGGFSNIEETCLVYIYYFPKVSMSACQSVPSEQTVYSSMDVEATWEGSIPPLIKWPKAYANVTLAEHMSIYDWSKNVELYNRATKFGSFEAHCVNYTDPTIFHYFPTINTTFALAPDVLCPEDVAKTKEFEKQTNSTRQRPTYTRSTTTLKPAKSFTSAPKRPIPKNDGISTSEANAVRILYFVIFITITDKFSHF